MPSSNVLFSRDESVAERKASLIRLLIANIVDDISETVCNSFCCYFVVTVLKGYRSPVQYFLHSRAPHLFWGWPSDPGVLLRLM